MKKKTGEPESIEGNSLTPIIYPNAGAGKTAVGIRTRTPRLKKRNDHPPGFQSFLNTHTAQPEV